MSEQKLLNSKQFAELCDISASTVKNWVESGKIKPMQSVNGKYYFAPEQAVDAYLQTVKASVNPSFLGLIIEDTEDAVENRKKFFIESITSNNPNARAISSLKDSLKAMLAQGENPLTEDQKNVLYAKIVSSYIEASKAAIANLIKNIYIEDARTRSYSFNFFLQVLSYDSELSEDTLNEYRSNKFTSKITTVEGMRAEYMKEMNAITIRHGLQNCLDYVGFQIKDEHGESSYSMFPRAKRFFEDADSVMKDILCLYPDDILEEKGMTKEDIVFGDSSTIANQFRKAIMKEKNNNLSKRGIQTIYREGYYTVMDAISIAQNFDTAECMRKLCSGDYRFVCVSNMKNLPDSVRIMIETLEDQNQIEVINFPMQG